MSTSEDWLGLIDPQLLTIIEDEEITIDDRIYQPLDQVSASRNPLGLNGKGRTPAATPQLGLILQRYYNEGMTSWEAIRNRLHQEHGPTAWIGSRSSFFRLTCSLGVGTARKQSISIQQLEQVIINYLEEDPARGMGYRGMTHQLRLQGLLVPKNTVYAIMRDFDQESLQSRRPGAKKLHRVQLNSAGPDEQWSIDGHDKLSKLGFGIYGIRDVFSGRFLALKVLPSNRTLSNALWVYMDTVCKLKGFPLQIASDRGSEVKMIYARQTAFRHTYSEIDCDEYPPYIFLKSIQNITIERSWRGVRERVVDKVKIHVESIFAHGHLNEHNPTHSAVLMWALSPLVQLNLDRHLDWFNSYKVRYQKRSPERWGGVKLLQPFGNNLDHAQRLKDEAEEDAGLFWVDRNLAQLCVEAADSAGVQHPFVSWQGIEDSLRKVIAGVEARLGEADGHAC